MKILRDLSWYIWVTLGLVVILVLMLVSQSFLPKTSNGSEETPASSKGEASSQSSPTEEALEDISEFDLNESGHVDFHSPKNINTLGIESIEWEEIEWPEFYESNKEYYLLTLDNEAYTYGITWPSQVINEEDSISYYGWRLISNDDEGEKYTVYSDASSGQRGIATTNGFSPDLIKVLRTKPEVNFYLLNDKNLAVWGTLDVPTEDPYVPFEMIWNNIDNPDVWE